MKRLLHLVPVVATLAISVACNGDDSPTDPSDETVTFLAQLSPANELPAVTGPEARAAAPRASSSGWSATVRTPSRTQRPIFK